MAITPVNQLLGGDHRFLLAVDDAATTDAVLVRVKNENEISYSYELQTEESNTKENGGEEISAPGVTRHSINLNVEINHGISDAGTAKLLASEKSTIFGGVWYCAVEGAETCYVEGKWLVTSVEFTGASSGVAKFAVALKGAGVQRHVPYRAKTA